MSDVNGDDVEDYLEIISQENVVDSDFSVDSKEDVQLIINKMNSFEKSNAELKETNTRILSENKKILKKFSSLEKKLNEKVTEFENLKNLISSLQENKKMKKILTERIDKNDIQIELFKKNHKKL